METLVAIEISSVFEQQNKCKIQLRTSTFKERVDKLKRLKSAIYEHKQNIEDALKQDLSRSTTESYLVEIVPSLAEIDFATKNLQQWMAPKFVDSDITTLLGSSEIRYEPKGTTLIIAPWNYPFYLAIAPLIAAISAGCTAIIKPSEYSPSTSKLIDDLIAGIFKKEEIAVFQGEVETSQTLLSLPFDHIFFTGSTAVGKIVMAAAAKNLSSVTLELGGKSPTIIHENANLKLAAEKIAWGKAINSGQTCIAPDYLWIQESIKEEFVSLLIENFNKLYEPSAIKSADYAKIISPKHFERIKQLLNDALTKGADLLYSPEEDEQTQKISTAIVENVNDEHMLMQEEIFGPILPIKTFKNLQEPIDYINNKPKPLALYIFSKSNDTINEIISKTSSGGVCVNDVILHIANPNLPFGGVNASGHGSYHGKFGFLAFSHERAIFRQNKHLSITSFIKPPYSKSKKIIDFLGKLMS